MSFLADGLPLDVFFLTHTAPHAITTCPETLGALKLFQRLASHPHTMVIRKNRLQKGAFLR